MPPRNQPDTHVTQMEWTIDQALQQGVAAHKEGKLQDAERLYRSILQAEPKHLDANYNLGVLLVSVGKPVEAVPFFKLALEANPKVEHFWLNYIDALIKLERFDDARRVLADAQQAGVTAEKLQILKEQLEFELSPSSDVPQQEFGNQLHSHRGELSPAIALREVGKYKEAQKWLRKVIEHDSNDADALSLLSHVLLLDKKEAEAERVLAEAASINSELPTVYLNQARLFLKQSKTAEALEKAQLGCRQSSEDLESLLVLAACLGANQRDLEALTLIEKILKAKSNYAEAYATRALIKLRAKDTIGAIEDAEMTVSLKPHLTQMWQLLSSLHYQANNLSDAIEAMRGARINEPENVAFMRQLGGFLLQDNKAIEAIIILEQAAELAPRDANVWTNLGVAFQQEKRISEAKMAYEKALVLNPRSAVIASNLGAMAKEAEEWESAVQYFEKALEIESNFAEAHNNLGNTLKELGRLDQAEASYRQAIALQPDLAEAHNNLGATLRELGRLDEAEASCKQAIALKPDYAEAHNKLGSTLRELGRLDEAEASYRQAIALKPDHAEAHNDFGNALKELGRLDQAEASYRQSIALKPDYAEAHRHLTLIKKFSAKDRQFLQMQNLFKDPSTSEQNRCHLAFALAKASEDLEDFASAFQFYAEGNALRKKQLGYDKALDSKLFEKLKASYPRITANIFEPTIVASELTPIFIVGMPRSGTTLVEQIISSHPLVTGAGELPFVPRFGRSLAVDQTPVDSEAHTKFRQKYLTALGQRSKGKAIVADKMPLNFHFLGLIAITLPEAKIIHVKRNPEAVCWANYTKLFVSDSLGYCYDLDDISHYHHLYQDLMQYWDRAFPNKIYHLDYEVLTERQEEETRKLIGHLQLTWDDACLSPQHNKRGVATASNLQVRKKVYQGSSEQWKRYKPYLKGAFDHFSAVSK